MSDTPTFGRYAEIPVDRMTPEQHAAYRFLVEGPRGRLLDSILAMSRKQQEDLTASEKRIRKLEADLEKELAEARKELERLRQIDLEVGRAKEND